MTALRKQNFLRRPRKMINFKCNLLEMQSFFRLGDQSFLDTQFEFYAEGPLELMLVYLICMTIFSEACWKTATSK